MPVADPSIVDEVEQASRKGSHSRGPETLKRAAYLFLSFAGSPTQGTFLGGVGILAGAENIDFQRISGEAPAITTWLCRPAFPAIATGLNAKCGSRLDRSG